MKRRITFSLLSLWCMVAITTLTMNAESLRGRYTGKLNLGMTQLRLNLNLPDGKDINECSIDSPDQGAFGIKATATYPTDDSIMVDVPAIAMSFSGKVTADSIKGSLQQRGASFPITFIKSSGPARPQTPEAPFPYSATDTTFINPADGTRLAGTIVMPHNPATTTGEVPAVVMVTGSGLQNRDEELFDHRPFLVIADYLARNGIASLRYDDRAFGESGGDAASATTATFASDAIAAAEFLRTCPGIGKVGILGHSEGGTIAMMAGAEGKTDFVISLAGALEPMRNTLLRQNRRALAKAGLDATTLESTMAVIDTLFSSMVRGVSAINVAEIARKGGYRIPDALIQSLQHTSDKATPWFRYSVSINSSEYIKQISCPIMAANGERDTQVDAKANLDVIRKLKPYAYVVSYPELNHLFQHCSTGEVSEYYQIEETISPEVLSHIAGFILLYAL